MVLVHTGPSEIVLYANVFQITHTPWLLLSLLAFNFLFPLLFPHFISFYCFVAFTRLLICLYVKRELSDISAKDSTGVQIQEA